MKELIDYIVAHSIRGACTCGKCCDAPENPETKQPQGHTADVVFFKVAAYDNPDPATLRQLIADNKQGSFTDVNLFDGQEHNYLQLGGWVGDQGLALTLMGLGAVLGLWKLLTPTTMLGISPSDPLAQQMAGMGMIAICAEKASAVAA
jgi:hypothetical protein